MMLSLNLDWYKVKLLVIKRVHIISSKIYKAIVLGLLDATMTFQWLLNNLELL